MKYTLITGACKGIGKAIAYECASRHMNVLLVSNDAACLQQVCDDIQRSNGVKSHCFAIDLVEDSAPAKVHAWVKANNFEVDILINNVGIGKGGTFFSMPLRDIFHIMHLNNKVLVEMTHHMLHELQKQKQAYILNISSLEATLPLPYKTVYTATKNFVYAFSLALGQELKFSNIHVSVLCPGPVLTNVDGLSRMNAHGNRSKWLMMYPEKVAGIAINGMLRRRQVIVPGIINSIFFRLGSLLPVRIKMTLLEKLFRVYKTS